MIIGDVIRDINDLQEVREVEAGDGWWRNKSVYSWTQEEAFVTVRGEIDKFFSLYILCDLHLVIVLSVQCNHQLNS